MAAVFASGIRAVGGGAAPAEDKLCDGCFALFCAIYCIPFLGGGAVGDYPFFARNGGGFCGTVDLSNPSDLKFSGFSL